MTTFTILPAGTYIYQPDAIHRVTVQFANEGDAIVFFEWLRDLGNGKFRSFTVGTNHEQTDGGKGPVPRD